MNSTMTQPHREAMAVRVGLSHLLDNFEDLRRPSSPSGLGPRFSSSSGWMDAPRRIKCELFMGRGSHRSKGRPNHLENGLGRPTHGPRPAGLPSFGPASVSSFACRLLASSRVYVLHNCTPLDIVILEISSRKGWDRESFLKSSFALLNPEVS